MPERRPDIWLPSYIAAVMARSRAKLRRRRQLTEVIFLICDHFEPRHGITSPRQPHERLQTWATEYARFQQRCREAFGAAPSHTWFYPPHHGNEHLARLSEMVLAGLGEVELHYHHRDDTEATLRQGLERTLAEYRRWGMLLESGAKPRQSFGFIHGDWALNNSCNGRFCGVNDEISILRELGCWADFTMPSGDICQTRKINSIYYGIGDRRRPKAHDSGIDARVGVAGSRGLLMLQGPLAINWRAPRHPRIENASLTSDNWGRSDRIRKWLDCNIHVRGRPEWLFVKLHAHGAIERDFDALFGERAFSMHQALNQLCNDGRRYRLHYVTARQAYNLVKAAEDRKAGNPADFLDYCVPRPVHAHYALDVPHELACCTDTRLCVRLSSDDARGASLRLSRGPVRSLNGPLRAITLDRTKSELYLETDRVDDSPSEVTVIVDRGFELDALEGVALLARELQGEWLCLRLHVQRQGSLSYRRVNDSSVTAAAAAGGLGADKESTLGFAR